MMSNKFEIKKEFEEAPKMVKMDHPSIPCCGFDCDRGYVQMYRKPDMPITAGTCFLRCSNSQYGCNQKMYLAYGTSNCMECKNLIKKVII